MLVFGGRRSLTAHDNMFFYVSVSPLADPPPVEKRKEALAARVTREAKSERISAEAAPRLDFACAHICVLGTW